MSQSTIHLRYGEAGSLQVAYDPAKTRLEACTPRGVPVADVSAATQAALAGALDHPAWQQTVYPGDRVTIGVDPGLPQAVEVLDAVIAATVACGVAPADLTVLFSPLAPREKAQGRSARRLADDGHDEDGRGYADDEPRGYADDDNDEPRDRDWDGDDEPLDEAVLDEANDDETSGEHGGAPAAPPIQDEFTAHSAWASQVRCATHDPADRAQLAYLAATEAGEPIFLNKALADADVVLLVSVARGEGSLGYSGVNGLLCQAFGDEKTIREFRSYHAGHDQPVAAQWAQQTSNEVAYSLGANFCLQVLPGASGEILAIFAGRFDSVSAAAQTAYSAAWSYRMPHRAELVIAAVDAAAPSWLDVAAAAEVAANVVDADGSIVLLTELDAPVGRSIGRLAQVESAGEALKPLRKETGADVLAAVGLAHALEQARVYLVSRLDESDSQDLHFIAVDDPADVGRLIARSKSCLLIPAAQFADVDLA